MEISYHDEPGAPGNGKVFVLNEQYQQFNGYIYSRDDRDDNNAKNDIENLTLLKKLEFFKKRHVNAESKETVCEWCGKNFTYTTAARPSRFCSDFCRNKYNQARYKEVRGVFICVGRRRNFSAFGSDSVCGSVEYYDSFDSLRRRCGSDSLRRGLRHSRQVVATRLYHGHNQFDYLARH